MTPAEPHLPTRTCSIAVLLVCLLAAVALPSAALAAPPSQNPSQKASKQARGCKDATTAPSLLNRAEIQRATLCLVNRERTRRGRRALKHNRTLEGVAERYSQRMAAGGFFNHVSPSGTTLTDRVRSTSYLDRGLRRWALGENIAWGTGTLATPVNIVRGWMRSPGHRRNILDRRFNEAGFGVVAAVPDHHVTGRAATYTNVFGQRVGR